MQYISVTKKGNYIHDCGYDDKGKKYKRKVKYKPKVYLESNNPNCNIKTLFGKSTTEITFDSMKEYNEYTYKNKRLEVHGIISPEYQYIRDTYSNQKIFIKPSVLFVDIEVYAPEFPLPEHVKYEINCLSAYNFKTGDFYQLSLKDYDKYKNNIDVDPEKIKFKKCDSEKELLEMFIKIVQKIFPDIMCGFYSDQFDFPYIINRSIKVLGKKEASKLSPFGNISCKIKKKVDRVTKKEESYFQPKIDGIVLLDYLDLNLKYGKKLESNSLECLADTVLGEGKVSYAEYDSISQFWELDHQKYTSYNIVDTKLLGDIENKLNLIVLHTELTYKIKCNFVDVFTTLRPWDVYIYNELLKSNICALPEKNRPKEDYPGAYIREPKPGRYDENVSVDAKSLYPNIIIQCNISPETFFAGKSMDVDQNDVDQRFVDGEIINKEKDLILTASGNYFTKNKKGHIPIILENLYNERIEVQKQAAILKQEYEQNKDDLVKTKIDKLEIKSLGIKLFMNSLYGAFANNFFRYYMIEIARSITLTGRLSIRTMEKIIEQDERLKKYNLSIVFVHTDSIVGDTSIYIDGNPIKIEDLYDKTQGGLIERGDYDFIKKPNQNILCRAFDTKKQKVVEQKVNYIMKHKVKKKMFKIKYKGKEVKVTQDHSVIIQREDLFISVTPEQIKKGDKIIII